MKNQQNKIFFITVLFTIFCSRFFAQNIAVTEFTENPIFLPANISFMMTETRTGKSVAQYRSCNLTIPASVMKIITTATALELLTPDFQFITKLEMDNLPTTDSILNGNLIIRGNGDPTLGSAYFESDNFLNEWVVAVKNAGIKIVKGTIIIDESRFSQTDAVNSRWLWEDVGNYYASGVYGIAYKDNSYVLQLKSDTAGTQPQILRTIPNIEGLHFANYLLSSKNKSDNAYICSLPMSYNLELYGTIPENRAIFSIKGSMPHPADVLRSEFIKTLENNNILVENNDFLMTMASNFPILLYKRVSPKLIDIINITNFVSNNHFAEHIFKQLALTKYDISTSANSTAVVKQFWKNKQLPVEQLIMCDGSGLSPKNGVSANFIVSLLNYMQNKSKYGLQFKYSLPAVGREGTVKNVLKNSVLAGKVRMKSGTISNVRCYAGYLDVKNGTTYSFAVLVNNANCSSSEVTAEIEKLLLKIYNNLPKK
ncbi:MAG: D-alanyl-D-alanine carboxypeptidase/D-alanyl-D-alanine-endopeptidase [Paludibacter sp.]|nr:D-alanyl-D-alanine carboxypeptidase/D-alanyl-D-alanine-endopeptidase [Paludibacter sp.]